MKQIETYSDKETKEFARGLTKNKKFRIIGLIGDLGAGKTTFVQGFAQGLGIKDKIISPTFVLIRQHKIPKTDRILYHIDLYRLENLKDMKQLGIDEIMADPNSIVLIEWAEKIKSIFPKKMWWISFKPINQHGRLLTLSHTSLL